jgi:hypothetical protein
MDIYVVSDVVWRDGAEILGVRATLEDAMALADTSTGATGMAGSRWGKWQPDLPGPAGRYTAWDRDELNADGSPHISGMQEIRLHELPD